MIDPAGRGALLFDSDEARVSVITADAADPDPTVEQQTLVRNGDRPPTGRIAWFRLSAPGGAAWLRYWTRTVTNPAEPGYALVAPGDVVEESMRGRGCDADAISVAAFDGGGALASQTAASIHIYAKTNDTRAL